MRCAVGLVIVGTFAAACSHSPEPAASGPHESSGSSSAVTRPSPSPSTTITPGVDRDPLHPVVVDASPTGDEGEEKEFYRGEDGTTLAILGSVGPDPDASTWYRIYGPGWKPRTPLLQVPFLLEILGPVKGGFIGHDLGLNDDMRAHPSKFVLVRADGTMRSVAVAPEPLPLQPTDDVIAPSTGRQMAYRPSTGQAHVLRSYGTSPSRYTLVEYDFESGDGCVLDQDDDGEQLVYWTSDSGHSWKREKTREMLRSTLPASMCEPAGAGRLVLVGSNELLGVARASTVELSPRGVSSYRLDKRFMVEDNLLFPFVLPDGRLAFQTATGLMVATSRYNSQFEFRPAPVDRRNLVEVVGGEMVLQNWGSRRNLLDVSADDGRTWHTVDLQAGDWTAAD